VDLLVSTLKTEDGIEYPAFDALSAAIENSTETVIISAFYDAEFLVDLMKKVPTSARGEYKLSMLFNGSYGRRLDDQVSVLRSIRTRLRRSGFGNVYIGLLRIGGGLFHTKLYLVQNRTQPQWFVGSANATGNGFFVNDEILLRFIGKQDDLRSYIQDKLNKSMSLDSDHFAPGPEDFTTLLRNGSLYFKSSAQVNLSFQTKLPETVIEKISRLNLRPRYTDPALPFSAFNIRRALAEYIDIDVKSERTIVPIRAHSVETCLGYWVPTDLTEIVDQKIEKRSGNYGQQLEQLANVLAQPERRTRTIEQFSEFLNDIEKATGETLQSQPMEESFTRYYDRLASRLAKPAMREKYARPLTDTPVPEMWDDPVASLDFKESFLLDVCTRLAAGQARGVAKTIIETIALSAEQVLDPEDLEKSMTEVIRRSGVKAFQWTGSTADEDEEE
jgi:hypothetical protein